MIKFAPRVLTLSLVVLTLFSPLCRAEEDSPSQAARELMTPLGPSQGRPAWEASLEGAWLPKSDSSDAGGSVGISETRVKLARSFRTNERLSLTPESTYSLLSISAPGSARLPSELHTASLGLRADYRVSPELSYSLLVSPGLAGDFKSIDSDDLRVRLGFTARYGYSDKLTFLGGLIYQQGYHGLRVFPILGALYRPDPHWLISIAAPRPGVVYSVDQDLKFFAGAEMFNGEYQLHQERLGARTIRYRDLRGLGGVQGKIFGPLRGEIAAGYAFDRRFTFYDVFDPTRGNLRVDNGFFGRAELKLFW